MKLIWQVEPKEIKQVRAFYQAYQVLSVLFLSSIEFQSRLAILGSDHSHDTPGSFYNIGFNRGWRFWGVTTGTVPPAYNAPTKFQSRLAILGSDHFDKRLWLLAGHQFQSRLAILGSDHLCGNPAIASGDSVSIAVGDSGE